MSNNEKIANWMGLSKMPDGTWLDFIGNGEEGQLYSELLFDTSWDWIMPACKKWDELEGFKQGKQQEEYTLLTDQLHATLSWFDVKSTFDQLVKCIDWYETQKP